MFWASLLAITFGILLIITLLLKGIIWGLEKKIKNQAVEIPDSDPNATLLEAQAQKNQRCLSCLIKSLKFISKITTFFAIFTLMMTTVPFSAFGEISDVWPILFFMFICTLTLLAWINGAISSRKDKVEDEEQILRDQIPFKSKISIAAKRHPYLLGFLITLSVGASISIPLMFSGSCYTFYNKNFGLPVKFTTISSRFMRKFAIPEPVCPQGKPCHVYATLPQDTATQVFLNVHAYHDLKKLTINYDPIEKFKQTGKLTQSKNSTFVTQHDFNGEDIGKRSVHSVLLTDLEPSTTYKIEVFYDDKVQYNNTYKTLPKDAESPVTIVMGGDAGSDYLAQQVTAGLYDQNPDVAIVGGDVAYDNAMQTCWYAWDEFFWMFEKLGNRLGKIVPIIGGVGNHDVGFDAGSPLNIDRENPPHYLQFMPQHLKPASGEDDANVDDFVDAVPDFNERRTYFHHKIGGTIMLSLDSDYVHPFTGIQLQYLNNVSESHPNDLKFAYYHNPTYPCCMNLEDTSNYTQTQAQLTWIPRFEKYNYLGIFENHVHRWKKTFPLKGGKVVDKDTGITYFGDGNWGTVSDPCKTAQISNATGIIEVSNTTNHVWIVKVKQQQYEIFPINQKGKQFYDSFEGSVKDKIKKNQNLNEATEDDDDDNGDGDL